MAAAGFGNTPAERVHWAHKILDYTFNTGSTGAAADAGTKLVAGYRAVLGSYCGSGSEHWILGANANLCAPLHGDAAPRQPAYDKRGTSLPTLTTLSPLAAGVSGVLAGNHSLYIGSVNACFTNLCADIVNGELVLAGVPGDAPSRNTAFVRKFADGCAAAALDPSERVRKPRKWWPGNSIVPAMAAAPMPQEEAAFASIEWQVCTELRQLLEQPDLCPLARYDDPTNRTVLGWMVDGAGRFNADVAFNYTIHQRHVSMHAVACVSDRMNCTNMSAAVDMRTRRAVAAIASQPARAHPSTRPPAASPLRCAPPPPRCPTPALPCIPPTQGNQRAAYANAAALRAACRMLAALPPDTSVQQLMQRVRGVLWRHMAVLPWLEEHNFASTLAALEANGAGPTVLAMGNCCKMCPATGRHETWGCRNGSGSADHWGSVPIMSVGARACRGWFDVVARRTCVHTVAAPLCTHMVAAGGHQRSHPPPRRPFATRCTPPAASSLGLRPWCAIRPARPRRTPRPQDSGGAAVVAAAAPADLVGALLLLQQLRHLRIWLESLVVWVWAEALRQQGNAVFLNSLILLFRFLIWILILIIRLIILIICIIIALLPPPPPPPPCPIPCPRATDACYEDAYRQVRVAHTHTGTAGRPISRLLSALTRRVALSMQECQQGMRFVFTVLARARAVGNNQGPAQPVRVLLAGWRAAAFRDEVVRAAMAAGIKLGPVLATPHPNVWHADQADAAAELAGVESFLDNLSSKAKATVEVGTQTHACSSVCALLTACILAMRADRCLTACPSTPQKRGFVERRWIFNPVKQQALMYAISKCRSEYAAEWRTRAAREAWHQRGPAANLGDLLARCPTPKATQSPDQQAKEASKLFADANALAEVFKRCADSDASMQRHQQVGQREMLDWAGAGACMGP